MEVANFIFSTALSAIMGAAISGFPLYRQLRNLKMADARNQAKLTQQEKINVEAEWKRILEERAKEETRLRARDDEQDRQIKDLLDRFIKAETSRAAGEERIRMLNDQVRQLMELLINRCPQCPSRPNLTLPLPARSSDSSPVPTVTSADSPSPSGTWPALGSENSIPKPSSSPTP